ncbi:sigma-70 family RNA polymerase sigma factor [Paractinoplanes rhizophilus]|uniref:Sigma-70 family RNA polymerase sigma factor n=1 Tax=Paractinoplanes rhizophilus TaxID=1416877 RepID=A0ABW2HIA5_9ACTN
MSAHTDTSRWQDLDELAERYAAELRRCEGPRARRLRDETIRAMLPMADRLARRYRYSPQSAEDVRQVARLGLVKAVERFDPARGSFTAYAVSIILGEIKRHFRDHGWSVHVPRRLQELALVVGRAQEELVHELHRRPTDAELADRCGIDVADVRAARVCGAGHQAASLNRPVGDGSEELGDLYGGVDPGAELVADQVTLAGLLERLPARDRRILAMRFHGDRTQSAIADELGISQMHVSRLISRALGWLREGLLSDSTPPWPGEADPETSPLTVVTRRRPGGRLSIRVFGEVDRDNADRLRTAVLAVIAHLSPGTSIVLDLSRMPMLDAAGVAALLAVHEAARVRGVRVRAAGLQPIVRRIAEIAGLRALLAED